MLVTNRLYDIIIPEDGVGGHTRTFDFIEFAIDEEKATENLISEMVTHELCHAARWGKNDEWINSLLDGVISEGIATYLEAEFIKDRTEKTVFIKTFQKAFLIAFTTAFITAFITALLKAFKTLNKARK